MLHLPNLNILIDDPAKVNLDLGTGNCRRALRNDSAGLSFLGGHTGRTSRGGEKMKIRERTIVLVAGMLFGMLISLVPAAPGAPGMESPARKEGKVRIGVAQPRSRMIDWRLAPAAALSQVDHSLQELEGMIFRAGDSGCDALAFPEDALGLLHWEIGNKGNLKEVLPEAVARMLRRLGQAAASRRMYLLCSSDNIEPDGYYRNVAFFLGRDGKEIGRYYKVTPTVNESDRKRGESFPVFNTPDLGGVGMLICYDMVMPESVRCLALAGADLVFVHTLGGAITAGNPDASGGDLDRAAFRTRAADNYVYLAVAKRDEGAMILSPQGAVLAEGTHPEEIVMADLDPFSGREGGDALNAQVDMRARLFRERNPAAYGLLTAPDPPVLQKISPTITIREAVALWEKVLTSGEERFQQAESLLKAGKTGEAVRAFERLRMDLPSTWIDRAAQKRLAEMPKRE
jgi:predicted amidohydrolase